MNCTAYFGKIAGGSKPRDSRKNDNPYEILEQPICLERKGYEVLYHGKKYFKSKEQIDWGSFLYKCTPEEILRFLEDYKITFPWLIEAEEKDIETVRNYIEANGNAEYGIIFSELV